MQQQEEEHIGSKLFFRVEEAGYDQQPHLLTHLTPSMFDLSQGKSARHTNHNMQYCHKKAKLSHIIIMGIIME